MAGLLEGAGPSFDAWCHKWCNDGVHADSEHIRYFRVLDKQQDKAFWYYHSGEHQLRYVELWSSPVAHNAYNHRYYQSPSR